MSRSADCLRLKLEGFPSVRSCGLSTKHRRPLPIFLRNGVKMSTNMKIKKRALTLHLLLKKPQKYCVAHLAVENQKRDKEKSCFLSGHPCLKGGTLKIFFDHSYLHMLNVLLSSSHFFPTGARDFFVEKVRRN